MNSLPKILLTAAGFLTVSFVTAHAQIIISEVMSSENKAQTYNQDWFELTNTGSSAVDITGWEMDDNSDSFSDAVALRLTGNSLAAGQSVVFIESTGSTDASEISKFESSWFGSNVPANFAIGAYSGSGVGLGSSGDQVNIFNASGTQVAGVAFGTATAGTSFDNSAGLNVNTTTGVDPTLTTLSVAGKNGAFVAPSGEIGSPGAVPEPMSLALILGGAAMLVGFQVRRRAQS
jgi:hypothetical protein